MSFSNNVIQNRIGDLSLCTLNQVISDTRASLLKISLHLNKTTDVLSCSQLIALVVRYIHNCAAKEDFLFSEVLKTTIKGKYVFQFVKDFFAKHDLDIQTIGSVCTDDALAIL